jgi:hypothetical protein
MNLIRQVLVTFPKLADDRRGWEFTLGPVSISSRGSRTDDDGVSVLVAASVQLSRFPSAARTGTVRIPQGPLRVCERALETVANLVSTAESVRRTISSPTPCLALEPASERDTAWLANKSRFQLPPVPQQAWWTQRLDLIEILPHVAERLDGVALLAESLGHEHLSGRFHELVRLFELGFRLSGKRLVDPLAAFLVAGPFEYTRNEVVRWIQEVRHGLTHADEKNFFLLEADVRPVIRRVEQAARDVLLNKTTWRSPSSDRRTVWRPTASLTAKGLYVVQHTGAEMVGQLLDDLGRYPRNMNGFLTAQPESWWPALSVSSATA